MGEIFERPFPPKVLEWTGERLTGDTSGQTEIEHLHRYFFARSLCRGLDVLDIASGEGYGSAMLAQVARSVTGVEIDEASVRHADEAYARPALQYLLGDARKIPLPDASVDAVVSFETLEHFFEHDVFMSEIRRVLRPRGFLVISSPERDVYSPAGGRPNPYHVHELTHREFDDLLHRHFGHVALYGQRPLLGAALIPEFVPAADARPFLTFERRDRQLFEASTGLPRSIYLVAIASEGPVELSRGSLFVETSGVEAIFARDAQARDEQKRLTDRLIEEGEYAQRVQAELNRRDEQLAAKVLEAEDLHRQLVHRNEEFTALEVTLGQSRAELGRRDEELAARAAEWTQVESDLAHLRHELDQLTRRETVALLELTREKAAHSSLSARQRALKQSAAELREQLVASQAVAQRQDEALAELRGAVDALVRQLAETTNEKALSDGKLEAVYRSSSWRLTGPIRGLAARNPKTIQRLRGFFERHPRIKRVTLRTARGAWRLLTLRSPRVVPSLPVSLPIAAPIPALPVAVDVIQAPSQIAQSTNPVTPGIGFSPRRPRLAGGPAPGCASARPGATDAFRDPCSALSTQSWQRIPNPSLAGMASP